MKTLLHILLLVSALGSTLLVGCESPLDANTPRIETPLTPAPKVNPRSIELSFETAQGSYGFLGTPTIRIDTTVRPMRFWIDIYLDEETGANQPLIQQFRVKVDSMAANGLIESLPNGETKMLMDVGNGVPEWFDSDATTNTAAILIAEHPREPGQPREVTITLYLIGNKGQFFPGVPEEQILGTIHLVI